MRAPATFQSLLGPIELIHAQAGPPLVRLARLGIFALWIFKLLLDPVWRLGDLPPDLIQPTGVLAFVPPDSSPLFWMPANFEFLWIVTLMVLIIGLTDRWFAFVATIASVLLTIYSSVIRSYGYSVHTDIVLLLGTYALALYAWADAIEKRWPKSAAPASTSSLPLVTIVAILSLTYCLVALNRIFVSFPVFFDNSMEVWTIDASLRAYYFNTEVGWHLPQWPLLVLFLRLGLPLVTLFELLAPLCLVSPYFRRVFIPFMLVFHALSLVLMNIFFFDEMLLYLLLIDWSKKFPALRARPDPATPLPAGKSREPA